MEEVISIESLEKIAKMLEKRVSYSRMVRVPHRLYEAHREAYTPQFILIGPFHHIGSSFKDLDLNLVAMESKKCVYMLRLLDRTCSREETLEVCWNLAKGMTPKRVRSCYFEDDQVVGCLKDDEVVARVILVDACFLLELFIWSYEGSYCTNVCEEGCGSMAHMILGLRRDLTLLENQLPFFVLQELYDIICPRIRNKTSTPLPDLTQLALHFFRLPLTGQQILPQYHFHLLDLISKFHQNPISNNNNYSHNFYWPQNDSNQANTSTSSKHPLSRGVVLRNATKLREAGVIFHRAKTSNMLDIRFNNGILEIPPLVINDCKESLLRNLLAFEHTSEARDEFFVSYVIFMDHLIGSKEDLQLLESRGIVVNELGGRDNVTKFFHHISKQFVLKNFYFRHLCRKIEKFCDSPRQIYVQELKQRYLNSPWKALSLVAAIVLLFLTAIQTVYTVIPYYKQGY